jgi:hypothetical protein
MKKIAIISIMAAAAIAGCKKKENQVSEVVTVSYPTITLTGSNIYSIQVGGALPTVSATAYDSVYDENDPVVMDNSALDNMTPGLYVVQITAKNKYGFQSSKNVYVGVTNVPAAEDISGTYYRTSNFDTAHVTKVATGMYYTDNVGGTHALLVGAYFVQTSDTSISFGSQPTSDGTLSVNNASLTIAPADTSFQYQVIASGFSPTAVRQFVKVP